VERFSEYNFMNWYKRANLQTTLPYFQEFEDMGEYTPNEESINKVLENQFGATIVSDIGQGDSGVAYLLSNGDILKITTNTQEGQVADYLWEHPNPNVVEYKLVWKEGDLYYIVMDNIQTMASDYISDDFNHIAEILETNQCYKPQCAYSIVQNDNTLDASIKYQILSYLSSLMEIPIPIFDFLNENNVGIKDGKLIFFDIT
jgi:hypothetical protein